MKLFKRDWPWAMIAGIIICLCIAAVVCVSFFVGPLQDTIKSIGTLLASLVVFGSSLIAYEGTTSKTKHDRKVDQREQEAKKINQALRAEGYAVTALHNLNQLHPWYIFSDQAKHIEQGGQEVAMPVWSLKFEQPEGIKQIWDELGYFSKDIIGQFKTARAAVEKISYYCNVAMAQGQKGYDRDNADHRIISAGTYGAIRTALHEADEELKVLIGLVSKLIPTMQVSNEERTLILYGEPSDGDWEPD